LFLKDDILAEHAMRGRVTLKRLCMLDQQHLPDSSWRSTRVELRRSVRDLRACREASIAPPLLTTDARRYIPARRNVT